MPTRDIPTPPTQNYITLISMSKVDLSLQADPRICYHLCLYSRAVPIHQLLFVVVGQWPHEKGHWQVTGVGCSQSISFAVILTKHPDKRQLRRERVYNPGLQAIGSGTSRQEPAAAPRVHSRQQGEKSMRVCLLLSSTSPLLSNIFRIFVFDRVYLWRWRLCR